MLLQGLEALMVTQRREIRIVFQPLLVAISITDRFQSGQSSRILGIELNVAQHNTQGVLVYALCLFLAIQRVKTHPNIATDNRRDSIRWS